MRQRLLEQSTLRVRRVFEFGTANCPIMEVGTHVDVFKCVLSPIIFSLLWFGIFYKLFSLDLVDLASGLYLDRV